MSFTSQPSSTPRPELAPRTNEQVVSLPKESLFLSNTIQDITDQVSQDLLKQNPIMSIELKSGLESGIKLAIQEVYRSSLLKHNQSKRQETVLRSDNSPEQFQAEVQELVNQDLASFKETLSSALQEALFKFNVHLPGTLKRDPQTAPIVTPTNYPKLISLVQGIGLLNNDPEVKAVLDKDNPLSTPKLFSIISKVSNTSITSGINALATHSLNQKLETVPEIHKKNIKGVTILQLLSEKQIEDVIKFGVTSKSPAFPQMINTFLSLNLISRSRLTELVGNSDPTIKKFIETTRVIDTNQAFENMQIAQRVASFDISNPAEKMGNWAALGGFYLSTTSILISSILQLTANSPKDFVASAPMVAAAALSFNVLSGRDGDRGLKNMTKVVDSLEHKLLNKTDVIDAQQVIDSTANLTTRLSSPHLQLLTNSRFIRILEQSFTKDKTNKGIVSLDKLETLLQQEQNQDLRKVFQNYRSSMFSSNKDLLINNLSTLSSNFQILKIKNAEDYYKQIGQKNKITKQYLGLSQ